MRDTLAANDIASTPVARAASGDVRALEQIVSRHHDDILSAGGTPLGSLAVEFGPLAMAWSPDGNHLAVLAPQATVGGLWLNDSEGRLERELALPARYRAAKAVSFISVSRSPDGRSLAVTRCPCNAENSGNWIVAADGSGARAHAERIRSAVG